MNNNNNTIRELLKKIEGKIFIWGGGSNGIFMECFLKEGGIKVTAFIDKRENYHGKVLVDNVVCQLPEQMTQEDACVITVSTQSVNEVYKKCIELNFGKIFICDTDELNKYKESIKDEIYLQYMWQWIMGGKLNLENPKTYNEKLQWLKLYDRKKFYCRIADKYEVRKYVEEKIGNDYLIPLVGIYNNFSEINFLELPSKFVLKCTHDSGSCFICKNKNLFDYVGTMKQINDAIRRNFYYIWREWLYKDITPRIICEELILMPDGKLPYDYKVFCFNGHAEVVRVVINRETHKTFNYYDRSFRLINDEILKEKGTHKNIQLPSKSEFDEMMLLSDKLSEDFPYCRIDFIYKDKFYFTEITFFTDAGYNPEWEEDFQLYLGNMIDLKNIAEEK